MGRYTGVMKMKHEERVLELERTLKELRHQVDEFRHSSKTAAALLLLTLFAALLAGYLAGGFCP